jgi:acyl-CoA oxidase
MSRPPHQPASTNSTDTSSTTGTGPGHDDGIRPGDSTELTALVYDNTFEEVHADLREALTDPVFDRREGLAMPEQGRLAYDRCRFIHSRMEDPRAVLDDPRRLFALCEWPALLDTTTLPLLTSHYNLCLGTILDHSTDRDDLDDYIEELSSMSSVGMLMVSELGYGNNTAAMRTRAEYDPDSDEFVLNTPSHSAQKFMPYTGIQDLPKLGVVMARLIVSQADCGIFPFIVRLSDSDGLKPGIHAAPLPDKPGLALDNGITWFDHIRLPRRNLLGGSTGRLTPSGDFESPVRNRRHRFVRSLGRVHPGRLCLASSLVTAGRASLHIALRYSARRHTSAPGQDDVPLLAYRSQQRALFRCLADVYAMTFLINHAKRKFAAADHPDEAVTEVAVAKAVSSWAMTDVLTTARERMGAQGMFAANRIADYIALAQGVVTAEGDNLPLLAKSAGELLGNGAENAEDAERKASTDPRTPPRPHGRSLAAPAFQLELLHWRQETLRTTTGPSLRRHIRGGGSLFSAWNAHLNPALAMAQTYGARLALRSLLQAAEQAESPTVRTALRLMAALYGLGQIAAEPGLYVSRGVLQPVRAERIPALLDELSVRAMPYKDLLIDGFALTDRLLRAPALSPGLQDFSARAPAHGRQAGVHIS